MEKKEFKQRRLVAGVGINDANYPVSKLINGKTIYCPFFAKWRDMLRRCYSAEYHKRNPQYKECFVCEEWLTFSEFKGWMKKQDWVSRHLDKDIKVPGNKIYSPDTCMFVLPRVNKFFNFSERKNGLEAGILKTKSGKFSVSITSFKTGRRRQVGTFCSYKDALSNLIKEKIIECKEVAKLESEPEIIESILNYYN